jgi:hypothetical protein
MMAEIMCEHFSQQTLLLMSDYDQSGDPGFAGPNADPQQAMIAQQQALAKTNAAVALLKNEKVRAFRIDIEDESTIAQDDQAEKQSRIEFLGAVSGFLQQAVPAGQQVPELAPLMGKMLLFGVRAFRSGRDMETAIEDTLAQMEASAKAAASQPKPPSPEEIAAKAEMEKAQMSMQVESQKAEAEGMSAQAQMMIEKMKMDAADMQAQRDHEFRMADLELKARAQETADVQAKAAMRKTEAESGKMEVEIEMARGEKDRMDNEEAQTAEMADRMDKMEGGLMEVAKMVQESHAAVVQQMAQLAAPKMIIRGPDGKARGARTALPGELN